MSILKIWYEIVSDSGLVAVGQANITTNDPKSSLEEFKKEHPEAKIIFAKSIFEVEGGC